MQLAQTSSAQSHHLRLRARAALDLARERRHELMECARHLRLIHKEVAELVHLYLEYTKARLPYPPDVVAQTERTARTAWRIERRFQSVAEDYLRCCSDLDVNAKRSVTTCRDPGPEVSELMDRERAKLEANVAAVAAKEKLTSERRDHIRLQIARGELVGAADALLQSAPRDVLRETYGCVLDDEAGDPQAGVDALGREIAQVYRTCDVLLLSQRT